MPAAVSNTEETVRHELKTCPGGFVVLRRMTYGQVIQRRSLSKMSILTQRGKGNSVQGELAMASRDITLFEFAHCIVEHNLEDNNGRTLNLGGPDFDLLDPRIGQEIEEQIAKMNDFEEDNQEN